MNNLLKSPELKYQVDRTAGQLAATERVYLQAMWGTAMDVARWLRGLGAASGVAAAGDADRRKRRAGLRSRHLVRRLGPGQTPPDVIARYSKEIAEIAALPDVKERIEKVGLSVAYTDGETFRKQVREDHERFGKIIREAGIKPN